MHSSDESSKTTSPIQSILLHLHRLLRKEIELAKAEVSQRINRAALGVGLVAVAAILALTGLNVLAGALTAFLVSLGLTPGVAALAVGGAVFLIAALLAAKGVSILKSTTLVPRETIRAMERDAAILKETLDDK